MLAPARDFPLPAPIELPLARLRVAIVYRWRHGRWPRLTVPGRFTEWVQWRKLYDRNHGLARLTDKLHAKRVAQATLGEAMVVPTLWHGAVLPDTPPAPLPLIVKSNHGCGQVLVIRTVADWAAAKRTAPRWLDMTYGRWLDEWHYGAARRLLLVEPYLGVGAALPVDYKIYVFGRRADIVQVHEDREGDHRWAQYDRDWQLVSRRASSVGRPASLALMLAAAEALAAGRDFLRVDFYQVDGRVLFGEFCLFPGSGLDRFDPVALDDKIGQLWTDAARITRPAMTVSSGRDARGCAVHTGMCEAEADH